MKIFEFNSYIDVVRYQMKENSSVRGYQSRLAEAAGVHSSFLSRVLTESVHLTPDQAAYLASFWRLTELEADYFLGLVNLARAGSPVLRKAIERQIIELKQKNEDIAGRLKKTKKITNEGGMYYSSWHYSAIHMLAMIPQFNSIQGIAERLGLTEATVISAFALLEELGLVERHGSSWKVRERDIHLPNHASWAPVYHSLWRQRSAYRALDRRDEDLRFTALHSLSYDDFQRIKEEIRFVIEKIRNIAAPSKEEDVFVLHIDTYKL
ncbi:MAG: TIGR02147 family protein [Bdellovibrionaceae bacterium]|nr:TIGR02147 family protein [Pseudobdellovibrionaceae bacterium]